MPVASNNTDTVVKCERCNAMTAHRRDPGTDTYYCLRCSPHAQKGRSYTELAVVGGLIFLAILMYIAFKAITP